MNREKRGRDGKKRGGIYQGIREEGYWSERRRKSVGEVDEGERGEEVVLGEIEERIDFRGDPWWSGCRF